MIDFFGIKARQTNLNHLRRITELEDEVFKWKHTCELQAQVIDHLKNDTGHLISDIDFPNSARCNTCKHSHCDNKITGVYYCHYWNHCFDGYDKCSSYDKR